MFGSVLVAVLITVSALVMGTSKGVAAAESTCQQVHGYLQTQVIAPGETQGTITQSELLDGTTHDHINLNSVTAAGTYTATFQDTTGDGTLVTQDNGQIFSNGTFVEYGTVDGTASTGRFAGATGSLTFNGSTTDEIHYTATVSGQICGANL
jgi:hypothetical protein